MSIEKKDRKKRVKYSEKLMNDVCSHLLFTSRSVKRICRENENYPTEQCFMMWIKRYPEANEIYEKHKKVQMHWLGEEVIELSDGTHNMKDGKIEVERDKLRVQTRLQVMALLNRKKYGSANDEKIESMKEQIDRLREIVRIKYKEPALEEVE